MRDVISRVGVDFQSAGFCDMLKVGDCVCEETVHFERQRDTSALEVRENLLDIFDASFERLREDHYIVPVYEGVLLFDTSRVDFQDPLKGLRSVPQTKWYSDKVV